MIARTIYQNLDTSFVDVEALLRHLQRQKFLGAVRVKLNGYEAEVLLGKNEKIVARESDQSQGRENAGETALQRVLTRTRQSRGTIDVFQFSPAVSETASNAKKSSEKQKIKAAINKVNLKESPALSDSQRKLFPRVEPAPENDPQPKHVEAPAELTQRAKKLVMTDDDWRILIRLSCEILAVINKSFATAGLEFVPVFYEIRTAIAADYPFMDPKKTIVYFDGHRLRLTQKVSPPLFAASINDVVRKLTQKLSPKTKMAELQLDIISKLSLLKERRHFQYQRFNFLPHIEQLVKK